MLSQQREMEPLDGYVTTPRPNYGCGRCGAWLFVHKVPITLREHVKMTETDESCFFFAKKGMNLLPDKKFFNIATFQSTK